MIKSLAKQLDQITSESNSAEESLERMRELQAQLFVNGDREKADQVKEFADQWEHLISD
jgi:hypothetical protein